MINSLHVAQTGLNASRTSVEGVMNNIANENTPGYKKRVVELSESPQIDGTLTGRGVTIGEAKRITDEFMYDNLLKEGSKDEYLSELSQLLSGVESLFFETEDSGFSSDLDRYFQSVENLRSDPSNEIYSNNLINHANILVDDLKTLYSGIERIEDSSINTVKNQIDNVNNILADIGNINEQIGKELLPPNDLLDKRDALEKELSQYVNIEVDRSVDYELKIGGITAVRYNTNVRNVSLSETYTPQINKFTDDGTNSTILSGGVTFDNQDEISFTLNNTTKITVQYGESITMDWDDDPATADTAANVDSSNYIRALVYKINNTEGMTTEVTAYNGNTVLDADGNEVLTNPGVDNFLVIKSNVDGEIGKFEGIISIQEQTDATDYTTITNKELVYKDANYSRDGENDIHMEIYDAEIPLKSGSIKASIENLQTKSSLNKLTDYKEALDNFASTLSDLHDSFITNPDGSYIYGEKAVQSNTGIVTSIGLFTGSTVKSLVFNENAVALLNQEDLEYLATIQWKEDIRFDGKPQDGNAQEESSFSEFYQKTQVQIASDKENNDYLLDTQSAILNSLQGSYDKIVKVDKDEEMLNLIKFQAAYEANAKIVTVVDEMLATLLGLKR